MYAKNTEYKFFLQTFSALFDCDLDLITHLTIISRDGRIETFQALFSWMSQNLRRRFTLKFVMEDYGHRSQEWWQLVNVVVLVEIFKFSMFWTCSTLADWLKLSSLLKENVAQSTRNNVIPSDVDPDAPLDLTTNPKNEQNSDNESIQLPLSFTKSCWRSFLVKFLKLRMEKS